MSNNTPLYTPEVYKGKRPRMSSFIVIEALDAGGSQTQTNRLASRFRREGRDVLQLHFPQEDRATGQLIYEKYLHAHNRQPFSKREQALLYIQDFFSRQEDIKATLNGPGKSIVISDRFYTSTLAYQSIGLAGKQRQAMLDWMTWLCCKGEPRLPKPDMVILLDTPVEVSLKHLRAKKKDYHENRSKLTAFRRSYLRLAQEQKWVIVNSMTEDKQRSIDDIHQEIWEVVTPLLPQS
jgi:dTMP kinase